MSDRRRGAVRSEAAHQATLRAAAALVGRVGFDGVTIEGIAAEAGVAKQTIYRWYKTKTAIIADCLTEGYFGPVAFEIADTGDIHNDLLGWLQDVFAYLAVEANAALFVSLISASITQPEIGEQLAERLGTAAPAMVDRFERAVSGGEFRAGVTPALLGETIYGVIAIRLLSKTPFTSVGAKELTEMLVGPSTVPH